jgi:hypothetical protein
MAQAWLDLRQGGHETAGATPALRRDAPVGIRADLFWSASGIGWYRMRIWPIACLMPQREDFPAPLVAG